MLLNKKTGKENLTNKIPAITIVFVVLFSSVILGVSLANQNTANNSYPHINDSSQSEIVRAGSEELFTALKKERTNSEDISVDLTDVLGRFVNVGEPIEQIEVRLKNNGFEIHKTSADESEAHTYLLAIRKVPVGGMSFEFYEVRMNFTEGKLTDYSAKSVFRGL